MLQNCKKFCKSLTKANMINEAAMQLASLSTTELYEQYHVTSPAVQPKNKLPRDFLINTLLARRFGQTAIEQHLSTPVIVNNPPWSARR